MATITGCLIELDSAHKLRDLVHALSLDNRKEFLRFFCPACKKPVHPVGNHFEHLKRNARCPLTPETKSSGHSQA